MDLNDDLERFKFEYFINQLNNELISEKSLDKLTEFFKEFHDVYLENKKINQKK